jgi:hypothetical protein
MDLAVDDVLALECPDVGFEVVAPAVARASPAHVKGERARSIEVGDVEGSTSRP